MEESNCCIRNVGLPGIGSFSHKSRVKYRINSVICLQLRTYFRYFDLDIMSYSTLRISRANAYEIRSQRNRVPTYPTINSVLRVRCSTITITSRSTIPSTVARTCD